MIHTSVSHKVSLNLADFATNNPTSKNQLTFENAGSFVDTLNSSPFLTDGLMRSLSNKKTVGVRRIL